MPALHLRSIDRWAIPAVTSNRRTPNPPKWETPCDRADHSLMKDVWGNVGSQAKGSACWR